MLQVLLDVHGEAAHFWELELWRTKQLPVSDRLQISNQWASKEILNQSMASTMQKLESTAKQASNRFYKYQNALQKKSLKIPKVCYDSDALILECGVYMAPQNMLW